MCVCYYCTGGALVTWKVNRQASVGSYLQRIKEYSWQDCIEYSSGTDEVGSTLLSEVCGGSRELATLALSGVPQAEKTRIDNARVWLCVTFGNRLIICVLLSLPLHCLRVHHQLFHLFLLKSMSILVINKVLGIILAPYV